ncbi:MAG: prostaglandin-endoperoxide synthase 2 [Solirubrobacteraceae bacterium]|nr:prostaglandin-endoperoxide synthase 2 [Solirubrobacteraceae bacterium]
MAVTVTEALSIYVWLRLDEHGHPWWGLASLVVGEMLETHVFKTFVDREALKRWGPLDQGATAGTHLRKVQSILGWAGNAEIGIWVLWLALAHGLGQPIAAAVLLVLMHLKHHVETVTVRDMPFSLGLFSIKGTFSSAMEVGGAVACLALIRDGHPAWGAVALGLGLLIEHAILIDVLHWELTSRDIRLPRDARWKPPARPSRLAAYASSHFPAVWKLVQRIKPLQRLINRMAINSAIARVEPRPNPLSTMAPYTSWASLTDRTFSGRHLPPVPVGAKRPATPAINEVAELFAREDGEMIESPKSTVLFSFFAQWFTDGFLRTDRGGPPKQLRNTRKNESNHEIDLAQLYGLAKPMTDQLRIGHGLLNSQVINGEEYPQFYCRDGEPKAEFDALLPPFGFAGLAPDHRNALFAMGTDTRNLGFMTFNVLFLREHNRIAGRLGSEYPGWDSDRVFETARNILTVVLLKIVVEEYINHISSSQFQVRLAPASFPNEPWYRPNWMAIEFNLLYRWHSLVPSTFELNGRQLKVADTLSHSDLLTSTGLGQLMASASNHPAGRIGLFNTDRFLVDMAEKPSIEQARVAQLSSYNDYRRLCRLPPLARFDEVSSDPRVQRGLAAMYDSVEDIEFYVGLFAEEAGPENVLPPLMSTMVAFDAFSQALTNPLLAPRTFNEQTFSAVGMEIIEQTNGISDIVQRNVPDRPEPYFVSLTRRDYKPA